VSTGSTFVLLESIIASTAGVALGDNRYPK